jgi:hypothetical protein
VIRVARRRDEARIVVPSEEGDVDAAADEGEARKGVLLDAGRTTLGEALELMALVTL